MPYYREFNHTRAFVSSDGTLSGFSGALVSEAGGRTKEEPARLMPNDSDGRVSPSVRRNRLFDVVPVSTPLRS